MEEINKLNEQINNNVETLNKANETIKRLQDKNDYLSSFLVKQETDHVLLCNKLNHFNNIVVIETIHDNKHDIKYIMIGFQESLFVFFQCLCFNFFWEIFCYRTLFHVCVFNSKLFVCFIIQ